MADDATLDIGLNQQELNRSFREAQQQIIANFRQIERAISTSTARINKEFQSLSKELSKSAGELRKIKPPTDQAARSLSQLDQSADRAGKSLQSGAVRFDAFANAARATGSAITTITSQVRALAVPVSALTRNLLLVEGAIQAVAVKFGGDAITAATRFETAQIGLQKVLDQNDGTIQQYSASVLKLSRDLGVAAGEALGSVATFRQASFTAAEAVKLAQDVIVLSDIGSEPTSLLSTAEATDLLTSALKGFQAEAGDSTQIIDILNEVSNKFAVNLRQLAIGFADFSPIAKSAGLDFQETAAILTPAIEVFRDGSEVARAFRTAFLRLGSDVPEIQKTLAELGISQRDANGNFRAAKDIYLDVAFAFQSLTKEQQLFLAGELAGKDQAAKFAASINGLRTTLAITSDEFKTAGSAQREFAARQESAQKAIDRTRESLNNLKIAVGQEFLQSITGVNKELAAVFQTLEDETKAGSALAFFSGLRGRIGLVQETLKQLAQAIPAALKQVDFTPFLRGIDGIFDGIFRLRVTSDGLASIINTTGRAFEGLGNFIGGVKDVIVLTAGAVAQAAAAFGQLPTSVQRAAGVIGGAALVLANFRLATLGVIGALAGLGFALNEATGFGDTFAGVFESAGISDAVSTTIGGITESFKDAFDSAVSSGTLQDFASSVKSVFVDIFSSVSPIIVELGRIVGETFTAFSEVLGSFSLDTTGLTSGLDSIATALSSVSVNADDVRGFIDALKSGFSEFLNITGRLFEALKTAAGIIFDVIKRFLDLDPAAQGVVIALALLSPVLVPLLTLIGTTAFVFAGLLRVFRGASVVVTAAKSIGGFGRALSALFNTVKLGLGFLVRLVTGPAGIIALGALAVKTALDLTGLSEAFVNLIPTDFIDAFGRGVDAVKNFFTSFISSSEAAEEPKKAAEKIVKAADDIKKSEKEIATVTKQSQAEIVSAISKSVQAKGGLASVDRLLAQSSQELAAAQTQGAVAAVEASEKELTAQQQIAEIKKQLRFEEQTRITQQRQAETFAAQEAKKQADEVLKVKIAARQQDLSDARSKLSEIVGQEKQAAENIKKLRQELASVDIRAAEQIADVRRRGLSERKQQLQLQRDAESANARAILLTFEAQRAKTEEERKAALEESEHQLDRAKNLAGQLQDTDKAVSALQSAANTEKLLKQEQIKLEEQVTENRKEEAVKQRASIQSIQEDIKKLNDELKGLAEKNINIDIQSNIAETEKNIDELKRKLQELEKGITIPIRTDQQFNSGGLVPALRRATGGIIPGIGNSDTVRALLTPGEFVIRKSAVERYGMAFLQAINSMRLPSTKVPQYNIPVARSPVGRSRFQTGGDVPGGGEVMTFRFDFGGQKVDLFGSREAVKILNTGLAQLARSGG